MKNSDLVAVKRDQNTIQLIVMLKHIKTQQIKRRTLKLVLLVVNLVEKNL
jgi:hypothetical protein